MVEYSGPGHRAKDACSLLRFLGRTSSAALRTTGAPIFLAPAGDTHWNAERQAVEFVVGIGEYRGVGSDAAARLQRLLPERPTPERCVEAYYLQPTRFESIAERKLRRHQLTEDGNVEIGGRDLR